MFGVIILQYLYEKLNIPDSCLVGNTIFKKHFYDNGDLKSGDKDIFTKQIEKIIWKYSLKPENINIKTYSDEIREYNEIEVVEVILNSDKKIKRIAEIIMRTIPYPMLLIFVLDDKVQLWVAHQRINLSDRSKNTIEEFIFTVWFDMNDLSELDKVLLNRLNIKEISVANMYLLYSKFVDYLNLYIASLYIGKNLFDYEVDKVVKVFNEVKDIDKELVNLKSYMKKETQINRKIELNIKIKTFEKKREEILADFSFCN